MGKFTTAYKEELRIPAVSWFGWTVVVTVLLVLVELAVASLQSWMWTSPFILYPFLALAPLAALMMIFFPMMKWEQRGSDIDREMHLFITRMGVLAASESARKEMFDILSKMREYRSLAVEINKIFIMVDKWNVSLERACRFVAQTTPSELLADFLNRLAHAVEGGEPAEQFFQTEQVVVMNAYALKYQGAMTTVEWMKELFISLMVAVMFVMVFASLAPFLIRGEDPNAWLGGAIAVFLAVDILFLGVLAVVVPGEDIWHNMALQTQTHVTVRRSLWASFFISGGFAMIALLLPPSGPGAPLIAISCFVSLVFLVISLMVYPKVEPPVLEGLLLASILVVAFFLATYLTGTVHAPLAVAYLLIPWLIPGHYVNTEEDKIKRRDENYAAFLRSLGAAVAATSKDITVPLSKLRKHDFGPLTKNVDDLYKRLSLRILRPQAWEYYSAETLSELISKFTEMYVEGIKAGGNPKKVSHLISENFLKIVGLRKMKYSSAQSLTGILYGLSFAISFVLYLTIVILRRFDDLASGMASSLPDTTLGNIRVENLMILNAGAFNFDLLGAALLFLLVAHAGVCAVMTRLISGGHKAGALWHLVLIVWLSAVVAVVTLEAGDLLMPSLSPLAPG